MVFYGVLWKYEASKAIVVSGGEVCDVMAVDYNLSIPNKKTLAPMLYVCGSATSTIMLGRSFHNLDVFGMKHLEY